jgi:hypothetical protein
MLTRKDRLLSTPNGLNGTSPTTNNRSITLETNCITQTKNLDKRSDFFNSLKNDSTNEGNKNGNKRSTKTTINSDDNTKTSKGTLLLLSVPETPEEKELSDRFYFKFYIFFFISRLLIHMGWKECDEITYEITDKDKEEYEKRIKVLPKVRIR